MKIFSTTTELQPAQINNKEIKFNWKGEQFSEADRNGYAVEAIEKIKLFNLTVLKRRFYVVFMDSFDTYNIKDWNIPINVRFVDKEMDLYYDVFPNIETVNSIIEEMNQTPKQYILC